MAGIAWCRIMAIKSKEVVAGGAVPIGNCFAEERRITETIRATWSHLLPQSLRIFMLVEKVCGRLTVLKVEKNLHCNLEEWHYVIDVNKETEIIALFSYHSIHISFPAQWSTSSQRQRVSIRRGEVV